MCTSLLRCWLAVLPLLARASTAQVLAAAAAPRAKPSQPAPSSNFVIVSEYTSEEDHAGGPSGGAEVVAIAPPPPRPPNAALLAAPDAFLPGSALNDTTRRLRRQASPVDQLANRQLAVMTAAGMLNAFQVLPSNGQVANASAADAVRRAHAANGITAAGASPAAPWPPEPTTSSAQLLQRAGCHLVPTLRGQQACREQHELGEPKRAVFKDRQTSVPSWRWAEVHQALLDAAGGDPWLVEDLEPYLYDMDYVNPTDEVARRLGPGPSSHLWDPELRETGEMHCTGGGGGTAGRGDDCPVTLYLPELYYAGDEYMGGWALEGFDGEGLRTAIGPNIAPGDDPSRYNYTYIPYAQRITFAPAASLFFPYLMSIYAGEVYIAETDPLLAIIARAARAGIVLDYYYAANYYSSYSFITTGVASAAVFATAARARGVIGAGFKVRNFNGVLASVSRDDYNERNRIILLNSLAFLGTSGGGYLFSVPTARNAFIGQIPTTLVPYYAYDYAGAVNPFPLQPAVGR